MEQTVASARSSGAPPIPSGQALRALLPQLADRLLIDDRTVDAMADDFGHLVHHRPMAVLRPGAAADIAAVVRAAGVAGLGVAARGQGHSTMGQAQTRGGVVVDMRSLSQVALCDAGSVRAGAGATWRQVVEHTVPHGLSPRVLTDYTDLSVGGTLSVGGLGMQSFHAGTLADNVLALDVVTGNGDLVSCSSTHHADLFDACRAGLGQFGIIVEARIALARAPARVRLHRVLYHHLDRLLGDLDRLVSERRFDGMQAFALPGDPDLLAPRLGAAARHLPATLGPWVFMVELAEYLGPGHAVSAPASEAFNDEALVGDLRAIPGCHTGRDMAYPDFVNRIDATVTRLEAAGRWTAAHPWSHLLVPWAHAERLIASALHRLRYDDMGQGPILISALDGAAIRAPAFRTPGTPASPRFAMLGLLCNPTGPAVARMQALDIHLYEQARALGGMRYAIDHPLTPADAPAHFGALWPWLVAAKQRFDRRRVLAPNQQLFTSAASAA